MPNVLECDSWAHGHLGGGLMPVLACWLQMLISKGEDYNPEAFWGRKKGSLNKWKILDTYVPTISELCTIQLGDIIQSWDRQLFYFIQRLCLIMSFLRHHPLANTSYLILISCLFKEQRQRWVFIYYLKIYSWLWEHQVSFLAIVLGFISSLCIYDQMAKGRVFVSVSYLAYC